MARPLKKYFFDFETDPFKQGRVPQPFAGALYGDNFLKVWWGENCQKDIIEHFHTMPPCEVYAHNGGKFDFFYFLEDIDPQELFIINGRIAKMTIGNVTLIDSFLLMPVALKTYNKDDIEYWKFEAEERETHKKEIIEYMVSDCRYGYELLNGFHTLLGKKLTIGAAAVQNLKDTGATVPHYGPYHDEIFRNYYYGGRVQAFKTGIFKKKLKFIDINSAYPTAMQYEHPDCPISKYFETNELPKKPGPWFATIRATSKGALPFKLDDGSLNFPTDNKERIYTVTGWEICAGLDTKKLKIHEVIKVLIPERTQNFKAFVDKFYNLRLQAKKQLDETGDNEFHIKQLAYKLCLNSGYGKFATNPEKFKEYLIYPLGMNPDDNPDYSDELKAWEESNRLGEWQLWERPADISDNSYYDVAVSASITGWVRAYMWRSICACKEVYYCDTDSIVCESYGQGVKIGKQLGEWDEEGIISEARIAGKKLYAVNLLEKGKTKPKWKVASKGVKFTEKEILAVCKGSVVMWDSIAPNFSITKGTLPHLAGQVKTADGKDKFFVNRRIKKA